MNTLQTIGGLILDACPPDTEKSLLYAELDDGVVSPSLFFRDRAGEVHFRFGGRALDDILFELWESGFNNIQPRSWAAIEYIIENGTFKINLAYKDQFLENEGLPERRPRVISKHFGSANVNYKNPHG
jgi:hypothetical protein